MVTYNASKVSFNFSSISVPLYIDKSEKLKKVQPVDIDVFKEYLEILKENKESQKKWEERTN